MSWLSAVAILTLAIQVSGSIASSNEEAQSQRGTVVLRGQVIDDLAAPLSNALVEVVPSQSGLSARTDDRGAYLIRAEAFDCTGVLKVRVRHIGFRPALLTVPCPASSGTALANVQLAPIAPIPIA